MPIEAFFREPTIATLVALIERHRGAAPAPVSEPELDPRRLLHKLQSFTASWVGERQFPGSLVTSRNSGGTNTPLFWVFQEDRELAQLSRHLGPQQPVHGMRSCVGIEGFRTYSPELLDAVCDKYLLDMLALPSSGPFVLGGNCQGGVIALHLARKLERMRRAPALLVLLDWEFDFGTYDGRTLMIYGKDSHVARHYEGDAETRPGWLANFTDRTMVAIAGKHGEYFLDDGVPALADVLKRRAGLRRGVWRRMATALWPLT